MGQQQLLIGAAVLVIVAVIAYFAYKEWWLPKHPKKGSFSSGGRCPCGCGFNCECPPSCWCRRTGGCPRL